MDQTILGQVRKEVPEYPALCGDFSKYLSVITVVITHQETRSAVPREGLQQLTGHPFRGRMAGEARSLPMQEINSALFRFLFGLNTLGFS